MVDRLAQRLVPDALWDIVKPLLPEFTPRPQGGGTAPADERAVFTAVVFVLTSGCAWRHLPPSFGVSVPTAHRRFMVWADAGVFEALHRAILDRLGLAGDLDWSAAILDAASVRAKKGSLTGRSPVDRGKKGSKIHVISDANGIPLVTGVSAGNTHDSVMLAPMVESIPRVRSQRGPRRGKPAKLRADKGYDFDVHRRWLRARGIVPRIARRGIEDPTRLGKHRWKIERTIAWLTGYRRLTIRYERHGRLFAAFLQLAAALTCYKKLTT
ncbi:MULTISPECIES: IS5 family transposase [Nocardia]|uniref:IS5 family transposase n=1 Tax=Nocardia cyriacigeorgica TaxID=135487 RepID=A0A5R8P5Z2_9NOCA|nr:MULTISPECIES: IS5 family transposase [Nocardia]MBF6189528.1 IS5 family transposase [Nocardia farcinica]MBF6260238.1 IS5 family transposase [Nocardia farcinica]MBF6271672.1 IS5 family transposase [Nocardia farcinica]MBF6295877.1 IS5 family transposase [Nocardia farcinica]MBF6313373.1 IS5 family transposase [Nocardia farcinica]